MSRFNLSEWALRHQAFTGFMLVMLLLGGVFAYVSLGQREDPEFTFRVMVVKTLYPGATAKEVEQQVTDRLEKKIQELPNLDYLRSYSRPGESEIFITPRQDIPPQEISDLWYAVRKKIGDIRHTLPPGVVGPFFNDEFGDTYSLLYAFSGEGFSYAELKDYVDDVRQQLLRVPNVEKGDLIGDQSEKIYVEFSDKKLAQLGLDSAQVGAALQAQNSIAPAGTIVAPSRNVPLRVSGKFSSPAEIEALALYINGKTFRLGDIASVSRGYQDPAEFKMRFNGKEAIGLGIKMNKKGDVLELGKNVEAAMARIQAELPVGVDVAQVANQPRVVKKAIGEFLRTFLEAVAIVLVVSFVALGWRTGAVVALTIPAVLAGTFLIMLLAGIDFHRISLGALILALGLFVDDAMIAVEMMARKLEEGLDRIKAASFAYASTAFPMLTGTLITVAGFLPVGLARSSAGEYTGSIFQVVGISLILSWVVAVVFTPFLGYRILKGHSAHSTASTEMFNTRFYQRLRNAVDWCVEHRRLVIVATLALFVVGVVAFKFVPRQFFPLSNRPELVVDMWLSEGASFAQTEAAAKHFEQVLAKDNEVLHHAAYIGGGTPRFFLLISQQLALTNLAEFVVMTKDNEARERVLRRIRATFADDFPGIRVRAMRLNVGPPFEYPVVYRVMGEDPTVVRHIAGQVAEVMRANPSIVEVNDDWNERIPVVNLELAQDKARALGVSSAALAQALQAHYTGLAVGQYREDNKLIDIVWRARAGEREALNDLANVTVRTASGNAVPVSQLAKLETTFEDGMIWRRNRFPTISVRADIVDGVQPPDVSAKIDKQLSSLRGTLPAGYFIEAGGPYEDGAISQKSILAWIPLVVVVTLIVLMVQLHNLRRMFLVFITAPLGVIGAGFALLALRAPFGFVALLGLIALAGMIMRNSVILVDQIKQHEAAGSEAWTAIVESTVRRFRPIMLTAAAAILAMIPLARNDFFGPQAITIGGGLIVATVLTVFFVPALYAAWFGVSRPQAAASGELLEEASTSVKRLAAGAR